jgi:hypothetical protein
MAKRNSYKKLAKECEVFMEQADENTPNIIRFRVRHKPTEVWIMEFLATDFFVHELQDDENNVEIRYNILITQKSQSFDTRKCLALARVLIQEIVTKSIEKQLEEMEKREKPND